MITEGRKKVLALPHLTGKRISSVARREPMPGSVYKSKKFEAAISKLRKVCASHSVTCSVTC